MYGLGSELNVGVLAKCHKASRTAVNRQPARTSFMQRKVGMKDAFNYAGYKSFWLTFNKLTFFPRKSCARLPNSHCREKCFYQHTWFTNNTARSQELGKKLIAPALKTMLRGYKSHRTAPRAIGIRACRADFENYIVFPGSPLPDSRM